MSAEMLREAAALMRSRAKAATPGPWVANLGDLNEVWQHEDLGTDLMVCDTSDTHTIYPEDGPGEGATEDAAHIASWHLAVTLAVADWLDSVADSGIPPDSAPGRHVGRSISDVDWTAALAVAAAYLGTAS